MLLSGCEPNEFELASNLPAGRVAIAYEGWIRVSGDFDAPVTWRKAAGTLPPGITISSGRTAAHFIGTPTIDGTFVFEMEAEDASGGKERRAFSITIEAGPTITTDDLGRAMVGEAYSFPLTAVGGTPPLTWTISPSLIPPGMILTPAGVLQGYPTAAGNYPMVAHVTDAESHNHQKSLALQVDPTLAITTTTLAEGVIDVAYSDTISATGGVAPYQWEVSSGALPPGIALTPGGNIATLAGAATGGGTFNFQVRVTDAFSRAVTRPFTLFVLAPLEITTTSVPHGTWQDAYSFAVHAIGGRLPYNWSLVSGDLPAGLNFGGDGVLSGTVGELGNFNFTVRVDDDSGQHAQAAFNFIVDQALVITTPGLPAGVVGVAYSSNIAAAEGSETGYSWAIVDGALPPGLSLAATGTPSATLTGTPVSGGSFEFKVRVTDSLLNTAERELTIAVTGSDLEVVTPWLPNGTTGALYAATAECEGGAGGYTWAVVEGTLPTGLILTTTAGDGVVSGTPSVSGVASFVLEVTDSEGAKAYCRYNIAIVAAAAPLTLRDQLLPDGVTGRAYEWLINATGGTGEGFTWEISAGELPAGLAIDSAAELATSLHGTPTLAGTYTFIVQVTDSAFATATREFTLKVYAPGTITRVAGGGTGGSGPPADLDWPEGVTADAEGNVYIADTYHHRVQRVDAQTGLISTFAGSGLDEYGGDDGPATEARMWYPTDVVVHDASRSLYIADNGNGRVRRVDLDTHIITTYAGGGSGLGEGGQATACQIDYPQGLCLAANGDLFITCAMNLYGNRVRKVLCSNKTIVTVAGTGQEGYTGTGGPATEAKIGRPMDVAVDAAGNVYISEQLNNVIRRVDASTGFIQHFAGTGLNGFDGDGDLAAGATFRGPCGLYLTSSHLWLADELNHRIRRIDLSTNIIETLAGSGPGGSENGSFAGDNGPATSARLNRPTSVYVYGEQSFLIVDQFNNRIRQVTPGGIISTGTGGILPGGDGGLATDSTLDEPQDVAIDCAGNVYIADFNNHRIRKVDVVSGRISTVAGNGQPGFGGDNGPALSAQLDSPLGVTVDARGNIYIADTLNRRIRRVDGQTGVITTICGTGANGSGGDGGAPHLAELVEPHSLAFDPAGRLLIADTYGYRIRRIDFAMDKISTIAGTGTVGEPMNGVPATESVVQPRAITVDKSGNIFFVDGSYTVRRIDGGTGIINHVAGGNASIFNGASGVSVAANGDVFVSDFLHYRVARVPSGSSTPLQYAGTGVAGDTGDGGPALSAKLMGTKGSCLNRWGDLYVLAGDRLRKVIKP